MNKAIDRSKEILMGCECGSSHHIIRVNYWDWGLEDAPEFYFELQSDMPFGFFGRVKRAFNYIFFGERLRWHDVIPKADDLRNLNGLINEYLERHDQYDAHCKLLHMKREEEKESNETL